MPWRSQILPRIYLSFLHFPKPPQKSFTTSCAPPSKPLSLYHKKPLQMTEPHFAIPKNRKTPPKNAQVYHYGFNGKEKTDELFTPHCTPYSA